MKENEKIRTIIRHLEEGQAGPTGGFLVAGLTRGKDVALECRHSTLGHALFHIFLLVYRTASCTQRNEMNSLKVYDSLISLTTMCHALPHLFWKASWQS